MCAAVEHAHRSLIVHRDLKPSNVLVGADGCVKLVDFGIAKLLDGEGERTRTEAQRLTRNYAAPEQIAGDPATTAIDVYALGVLLAELLSGLRPRRSAERGSTDVPVLDDAVLRQRLGIDLHAIVREATRIDPIRRYPSVASLSADLRRYLDGKPLQARADTFAYRLVTLTKRHALAVAAAATMAIVLAGATAVSLYETHLARGAAANARAQALVAGAEARRADAVKAFLEGLFDSASPGLKTSQTAEELLARGRERADVDFATQPALRVEILALVGDLERRSGHPDGAQQPLEQAAALAKTQFGATDRRTLHVETLLAMDADELGRAHAATARLQGAVDAFDAGASHGSREEVQALAWLAGLDERIGKSAKAIELGEEALALARRALPDDSDELTEAVMNLGWTLMDAGRAGRAEPLLREALVRTRRSIRRAACQRRRRDVDPDPRPGAMRPLRRKRTAAARRDRHRCRHLPARASACGWHLNNLASVLSLEGRLDEAGAFYLKSIALDQTLAPAAAISEALSLGNLARLRFRQGAYAEAEAGLRDAIERKQRLLGADYADNGRSYDLASLADILLARGNVDEAASLIDTALDEARRRYPGAHPDVAFALAVDARLAAARGDRDRAATLAAEAVATYDALADTVSDKAIRTRLLLGETLLSLDRAHAAKRQFETALAAAQTIIPSATLLVAHAAADVGRAEAALGGKLTADRIRAEAKATLAAIRLEPSTERDAVTRLLAGDPLHAKF